MSVEFRFMAIQKGLASSSPLKALARQYMAHICEGTYG